MLLEQLPGRAEPCSCTGSSSRSPVSFWKEPVQSAAQSPSEVTLPVEWPRIRRFVLKSKAKIKIGVVSAPAAAAKEKNQITNNTRSNDHREQRLNLFSSVTQSFVSDLLFYFAQKTFKFSNYSICWSTCGPDRLWCKKMIQLPKKNQKITIHFAKALFYRRYVWWEFRVMFHIANTYHAMLIWIPLKGENNKAICKHIRCGMLSVSYCARYPFIIC